MKKTSRDACVTFAVFSGLFLLQGCSPEATVASSQPSINNPYAGLEREFDVLVTENEIVTAGAAIITNGQVTWIGNFGEQAPGIMASEQTLYNVGSITKTVAAETILRLVSDGTLSLDASMSPVWVDPDLEDDSRHELLTPRVALTHTTGFPNWRYFTANGKLAFNTDPGTSFTYSGEGYEYLATYSEKLTDQKFEALVQQYVFDPIGIENASYSIDKAYFDHIAQAKAPDGSFPGHYCYPDNGYCRSEGSSTPADDLVISVSDFALFLISVMNSDGYDKSVTADRNTVHVKKTEANSTILCDSTTFAECPIAQGYGLGWEVLDFGDRKIVSHGGSDWHELALAYFDTQSKDGVIIFLNAPSANALKAMPKAISLLDADSPMVELYERWLQQAEAAAGSN